ncbi:hypothetical protein F1721_04060 [Saccharopolyspora hirsuta]|uniref:CopG family transcriptional regulator n=1 Tax=Saccharopolyspora hirsuta TaxID=1837 RepID=A0A5M7C4J8_SACHI|nr:hypothetical protein [Saccharopolyspora hirsuta]KAA5837009.1 hypothetical protein F1721_04060 [Saccharopolyspora hirsuta]
MSALPNDPPGGSERGRDFTERLALLLSQYREFGEPEQDDVVAAGSSGNVRSLGRARKVSVSMPEELTAAVQRRVGRGAFSQYVTDAVSRQLELDLLAELSGLLDAEHGPVPEEFLAEARAAWPDVE